MAFIFLAIRSRLFSSIAMECGMQFELIFSDHVPKVAILASKLPHCLQDLLLRQERSPSYPGFGLGTFHHAGQQS